MNNNGNTNGSLSQTPQFISFYHYPKVLVPHRKSQIYWTYFQSPLQTKLYQYPVLFPVNQQHQLMYADQQVSPGLSSSGADGLFSPVVSQPIYYRVPYVYTPIERHNIFKTNYYSMDMDKGQTFITGSNYGSGNNNNIERAVLPPLKSVFPQVQSTLHPYLDMPTSTFKATSMGSCSNGSISPIGTTISSALGSGNMQEINQKKQIPQIVGPEIKPQAPVKQGAPYMKKYSSRNKFNGSDNQIKSKTFNLNTAGKVVPQISPAPEIELQNSNVTEKQKFGKVILTDIITIKGAQCDICGKKFTRTSSVRTHFKIHTGETPFKCPWVGCEKRFNVRGNMLRHQKSQHNRKSKN